MRWRIIPYSEQDAYTNMAIDEMLCRKVSEGADPVIRFYGWNPSAVSVGYFQSMEGEVDMYACLKAGVDTVRRRTGGGAVYHDHQGEITYSVIGAESLFPKDIIASYRVICGWIVDSLSFLGISSQFAPINDIVAGGRKISGNAQTRRGGVLLQHGTILHKVDPDTMFSLLRVPDEKVRNRMITTVKERVTSVYNEKNVGRDELLNALLRGFCDGKETVEKQLDWQELDEVRKIREMRYLLDEWNFQR
jgi:lipoate-protein ligase A